MLSAGLEACSNATLATGAAFMATLRKSTGATDGEGAALETVGEGPEGVALIDVSRAFVITIRGEECTGSGMSNMSSSIDKKRDEDGGLRCPVGSIIP
jgi:hypothetical protein